MPRVSSRTITTCITRSEWDQRELLACLGVIHKDHKPDPDEEIKVSLTNEGGLLVEITTREES